MRKRLRQNTRLIEHNNGHNSSHKLKAQKQVSYLRYAMDLIVDSYIYLISYIIDDVLPHLSFIYIFHQAASPPLTRPHTYSYPSRCYWDAPISDHGHEPR